MARFGIANLPQSLNIRQNSDELFFQFQDSGQSLLKGKKLRPVIKLGKRNKTTSKKLDDDVMSANCDAIIIFLIYGQFGAIPKPDSVRIFCKSYIFCYINLFFCRN